MWFMVNLESVFEVALVLVEGDPIANLVEVEGDKALQLVGELVGQKVGQLVDQAGVEVEAIEWAQKITKLLLVKLCNNQKYMILQLIMTSIPILGCLIFLPLYIIN
jgi:hypothetical protein